MEIRIPDINEICSKITRINAKFNGETKSINEWVLKCREDINKNNLLLKEKSNENDMRILKIILQSVLIRAMKGEVSEKIRVLLEENLKTKEDLILENYKKIVDNYRWGIDKGAQVISDVVSFFREKLNWDFVEYFQRAKEDYENNFQKDKIKQIKHIGFKLRDLALSNFNENYAANDLHVVRVITRIGLLNEGFNIECLKSGSLEMGNNPSDEKQYLFLHKLILRLSKLTKGTFNEYSPVDLDRIFWHFGRTVCKSTPNCNNCPIKDICLTGKILCLNK